MANLSQTSSFSSLFDYVTYLNTSNDQINNIMSIGILSLGVPGNLISLLVFWRLIYTNKTNMGMLYTLQCSIDLFALVWVQIATRNQTSPFDFTISDSSEFTCRMAMYLRRLSLHMCSWMAVISAFDRFVFVFYEHRFGYLRRKSTMLSIIASTLTLLALVNFINFFYYLQDSLQCTASFGVLLTSDLISIVFRTYIPFALIFYFNFSMIRKLDKSSSSFSSSSSNMAAHTRGHRRERHFTIAVMSHDVMFFATHFPLSISSIVFDLVVYSRVFESSGLLLVEAQVNFAQMIFQNVSFLDKAFSFFTYFTFNKLFRKQFFRLTLICLPLSVVKRLAENSIA